MQQLLKRLSYVVATILLLLVIHAVVRWLGVDAYFRLASIQQQAELFKDYVHSHYYGAVLFYEVIFIGATLFFIPVTIVLSILALSIIIT